MGPRRASRKLSAPRAGRTPRTGQRVPSGATAFALAVLGGASLLLTFLAPATLVASADEPAPIQIRHASYDILTLVAKRAT